MEDAVTARQLMDAGTRVFLGTLADLGDDDLGAGTKPGFRTRRHPPGPALPLLASGST